MVVSWIYMKEGMGPRHQPHPLSSSFLNAAPTGTCRAIEQEECLRGSLSHGVSIMGFYSRNANAPIWVSDSAVASYMHVTKFLIHRTKVHLKTQPRNLTPFSFFPDMRARLRTT
jgi:hypothetical protein